MHIPDAPSCDLTVIQEAWDTAQRFRVESYRDLFAEDFCRENGVPLKALPLSQKLETWVPLCLRAMGLLAERPTHPGLNEEEFGLLRIEDLFCRFLERTGPTGAKHADRICGADREDRTDPTQLAAPLLVVDGYPVWLRILADVILREPDAVVGARSIEAVGLDEFPHLGWTKWLLLTEGELVDVGVPKTQIAAYRLAVTGHDRPMTLKWARSIGMWGRVKTMKEIATATGATTRQVVSYKTKVDVNRPGGKAALQAKDGRGAHTQLDLAHLVGAGDTDNTCEKLGILRIEAILYEDMYRRIMVRIKPETLNEDVPEIARSAGLCVALPEERWGTLASDIEE